MIKFNKRIKSWMCLFGLLGVLGFFPNYNRSANYIFFLLFSLFGLYWAGKIDFAKHPIINNKLKLCSIICGAFVVLCAFLIFLLAETLVSRDVILAIACFSVAIIVNVTVYLMYKNCGEERNK
jgi:hypothetical protein